MPLGSDVRFIIRTGGKRTASSRTSAGAPQCRAGKTERRPRPWKARRVPCPRFRKVRKPPLLCVAAAVPPPLPIGTERVPFFSPDAVAPPPCRIRQCGRVARKSCACAPVARGCGFGANPPLPSSTMPGRGPTQESPPGNRAHVYNPSQAPMYRQEIKKGLLRLDFRGMGNWATEGIA